MSDWPSSLPLGVLTVGPFIGTGGHQELLKVWAEPVYPKGVDYVVHGDTGVSVPPFRESFEVTGGQVQMQLPLCDDPTLTAPDGTALEEWHYRVHAEVINKWHDHWILAQDVRLTVETPYQRMAGALTEATVPTRDGTLGVSVKEDPASVYTFTGPGVVQVAPNVVRMGQ